MLLSVGVLASVQRPLLGGCVLEFKGQLYADLSPVVSKVTTPSSR